MAWLKKSSSEPLTVSMSGVKLGDRALVVGAGDVKMLAGIAAKTGLTGRTCVVDEDEARTTAAVSAAERDGALVEGFTAPWTSLPFNDKVFDLAIVYDVLPELDGGARAGVLHQVLRVLRPGGRCLAIDRAPGALAALVSRRHVDATYAEQGGAARALESHGFRAVRTVAQREGLLFVEGVRVNA